MMAIVMWLSVVTSFLLHQMVAIADPADYVGMIVAAVTPGDPVYKAAGLKAITIVPSKKEMVQSCTKCF